MNSQSQCQSPESQCPKRQSPQSPVKAIRRAQPKDLAMVKHLLDQVDLVHHNGRPDIFNIGRKYNDEQILEIFGDDRRPVFVAVDEADEVLGYCFGIVQESIGDNVVVDHKTFYIDDLCVDEQCRGGGVGRELYRFAVDYARKIDCYNVTLNVWECNPSARAFYDSLGMKPMKTYMEEIL